MLTKSINKMTLEDFKKEYTSTNMSMWVVDTLLAAGIDINYIKLDWAFVHRILNWKSSPNVILMTRAILEEARKKDTKIIWEWFDNPEQFERLSEILGEIHWAQWRNLDEKGFKIKNKETSNFRLNHEMKSFTITDPQGNKFQDVSALISHILTPFKSSNIEDKPVEDKAKIAA